MRASQAVPFLLASIAATVNGDGEVYSIHGSGTTNPSKCIWHIMSLFEERSRVKTHLTYRAVGSSTGQAEFLGADNTDDNGIDSAGNSVVLASHVPYNDFGAGDIPIKKKDYDALNSAANHGTANVAHLPFAMSSVSFFHNIPNVPDGGINLDACLLARIFSGDIQEWDSAEILEKNEDLRGTLKGKIFVARRVQGSSSTKSITQFMNAKCKKYWPDNLVQSKLDGENAWSINTNGCEGSAGMTSCIRDNANSIGYIDSGHGWSEELKEVSVMNEDGNFLTSRYSHSKDGIANAANSGITPNTTIADWSDVDFLNKGGEFTWPIVVMSYIYVRTDLHRFIREENERGMLKLFLEAIYNDEYFGACEELGFSKPPEKVVAMATKAIGDNTINFDFAEDKNMWTFEFDTQAKIGQGKFVISSKRRSLAGMDIQDIAGREKKVRGDVEFLSESFHELFVTEEGQLRNVFEELNDQKKRNQAALVLGAISFTLWMCTAVAWVMMKCLRRK